MKMVLQAENGCCRKKTMQISPHTLTIGSFKFDIQVFYFIGSLDIVQIIQSLHN